MDQNYYFTVLADQSVEAHGWIRASDGDEARDKVFEQAREEIDFKRFPEKKWNIVVTEKPAPLHLRSIEALQAYFGARLVVFCPLEHYEN